LRFAAPLFIVYIDTEIFLLEIAMPRGEGAEERKAAQAAAVKPKAVKSQKAAKAKL
jgi:hypothetical protein